MPFYKILIRFKFLVVCAAFSCANLPVFSQLSDYAFAENKNSWLSSENPVGINVLDTVKITFAEIYLNKGNGEFKNYFESNNSFEYGVLTESYYRLSAKSTVSGKILYSSFEGKNMGGSTSIDPYYNPFDIVEYADSTAGTKKKETYYLEGTLSTQLTRRLLLGLHAGYKNISYYKIRDLRHTNDFMDLNVKAGVQYNFNRNIELGFHYAYRRSTEGISFQSAGNKDQQFNSLINYGAFLGKQERFGESGYTSSADNKPFFNKFHTLGFQVNLFPSRKISLYNELSASMRSGYYGKNSSTSILYTEHEATLFHYKGIVSIRTLNSLHKLELVFDTEDLVNRANDFREETIEGANTVTVYIGQNKVLNRTVSNLKFGYSGNFGIKNNYPSWELKAQVDARISDIMAVVYPVYRMEHIDKYTATLSAGKNIFSGNNIYTVFGTAGYSFGTGYAAKNGLYNSSANVSVFTIDRYLYREYEYLTAARIKGEAGFCYTKVLPDRKLKLYTEIAYGYTRAFDVSYLGNSYGELSVRLGCRF